MFDYHRVFGGSPEVSWTLLLSQWSWPGQAKLQWLGTLRTPPVLLNNPFHGNPQSPFQSLATNTWLNTSPETMATDGYIWIYRFWLIKGILFWRVILLVIIYIVMVIFTGIWGFSRFLRSSKRHFLFWSLDSINNHQWRGMNLFTVQSWGHHLEI